MKTAAEMKPQTVKDTAGKSLITTVSLDTIAAQANREHQLASDAACNALEHAAACGELLNKAKSELGHGNFLPWLKENFAGSERTAQNYMRLASNPQACGFGLRLHPRRHRGSDRPAESFGKSR